MAQPRSGSWNSLDRIRIHPVVFLILPLESLIKHNLCPSYLKICKTKMPTLFLPKKKKKKKSAYKPTHTIETCVVQGSTVFLNSYSVPDAFLGAAACQCRRHRLDRWSGKIPWRRKWQPTPVFLLGEPHGQRSLEGPWGHKGSDMTHDWTKRC